MHDLRAIRDNPAEFDQGLARRGLPPRAEEILALDHAWRAAETRVQEVQARRNQVAKDIAITLKGVQATTEQGSFLREEKVAALRDQSNAEKEIETEGTAEAARLRAEIDAILAAIPNLPAPDVPDGADQTPNHLPPTIPIPPPFT